MATCINCSNEVASNYCPNCGQRNPVKSINFSNLWSDFASRIYGFDGMFPRTLKDLTLSPGRVAREYISGNRVKYYGPVGYFFLMVTLYLLIASLLGIDIIEFTMKSSAEITEQQGEGQREFNMMVNQWVNDNFRLVSFITALFVVFFTWLFFRKSGYNIIETSVLIFFVNGHTIWLSIFSMMMYSATGYAISFSITLIVQILFLLFAFSNLYSYQKKWKIVLKGLLLYITSYIAMMLIVGVYIFYLAYTDKTFLEKIRPSNNKPKVEQTPVAK